MDYIKIPKDFQSLHDLKELVSNYDLVNRLSNALTGYQRMYIDSYLMNMSEVLDYIPESQHGDYHLRNRDDMAYTREFVTVKNGKDVFKTLTLRELLLDVVAARKKGLYNPGPTLPAVKAAKIFLPDTVNKIVDVCYWASPKTMSRGSVDYKGNVDFSLDEETRELLVMPHYKFTDSQAVGGCRISTYGGNGYLSGHTYHDYERHGHDIYKFCTRTNKFTGYGGCKQDPARPWLKKTSRY